MPVISEQAWEYGSVLARTVRGDYVHLGLAIP